MKKLFSMALVVLTAALVNSVFAFAKYVDITTTYTGGDVTDFPVLVKITTTTPTGFYSDVKHDGKDLKFTDDSGNGDYPYEIDTWNASGDSYIWVKLPKLSADMTFRMYYGDEDQTQPTNPSTAVWTGYERVLHASEAKDSAKGGLTGLCEGGRSVSGPVGLAYGQAAAGGKASLECDLSDHDSTRFTVSGWMRANEAVPIWTAILGPRNNATALCWGLGSTSKSLRVNVAGKDTGLCKDFTTQNLTPVGEWVKFDIVYNDLTTTLYINGQMVESPFTTTKPACRVVFEGGNRIEWMYFGGVGDGQTPTDSGKSRNGISADFDECRILNVPEDATRVAADYQTVANVATFLEFGDPQGGGPTVQVLPQGVIVK